jgi:hypothetical protein
VLPLCVVAASIVAVQGLFRVVGQPTAPLASQQSPLLDLAAGAAGAPDRPAIAPASPRPSPTQLPRPPPATRATTSEHVSRPVAVLNASDITGLAERTAVMLRLRGVRVASVGNLSPAQRPSTPTVYYPPGGRGQAQALATLTGAKAVAPAPGWLPPDGRLVLVVTDASTASGT